MEKRISLQCSYKRVKGRSHTVEKRKASHPQKPHATSQPPVFVMLTPDHRASTSVLHGEISKRLATPRNTKDKKHLQSTQSASQTKHQALPKGQPGRRITPINTAAVDASAQQQPRHRCRSESSDRSQRVRYCDRHYEQPEQHRTCNASVVLVANPPSSQTQVLLSNELRCNHLPLCGFSLSLFCNYCGVIIRPSTANASLHEQLRRRPRVITMCDSQHLCMDDGDVICPSIHSRPACMQRHFRSGPSTSSSWCPHQHDAITTLENSLDVNRAQVGPPRLQAPSMRQSMTGMICDGVRSRLSSPVAVCRIRRESGPCML